MDTNIIYNTSHYSHTDIQTHKVPVLHNSVVVPRAQQALVSFQVQVLIKSHRYVKCGLCVLGVQCFVCVCVLCGQQGLRLFHEGAAER